MNIRPETIQAAARELAGCEPDDDDLFTAGRIIEAVLASLRSRDTFTVKCGDCKGDSGWEGEPLQGVGRGPWHYCESCNGKGSATLLVLAEAGLREELAKVLREGVEAWHASEDRDDEDRHWYELIADAILAYLRGER